jgi:DNA repair protein REV1
VPFLHSLHHLSTWKAELKVLTAQAQAQAESNDLIETLAPGAVETTSLSFADSILPRTECRRLSGPGGATMHKVIMHVDFDAFFVSCGIASRPELKGKPVAVCHSQSRGGGAASTSEIASCSYEARAKGVRNGMSLGQARKLCPEIQTIP